MMKVIEYLLLAQKLTLIDGFLLGLNNTSSFALPYPLRFIFILFFLQLYLSHNFPDLDIHISLTIIHVSRHAVLPD